MTWIIAILATIYFVVVCIVHYGWVKETHAEGKAVWFGLFAVMVCLIPFLISCLKELIKEKHNDISNR